jgi:hypothetical protein
MKLFIAQITYFIRKVWERPTDITAYQQCVAVLEVVSGTYYVTEDGVIPQFGSRDLNLTPNNNKYIGKVVDINLLVANMHFNPKHVYNGVDFSYYPE